MTTLAPPVASSVALAPWLRACRRDDARARRIEALGLLTALKHTPERGFFHSNLERGLLLDRLVETRRPRRALEIGTGRGLGALALASAARAYGAPLEVVTVDLQDRAEKQAWPLDVGGERSIANLSRDDVWGAHVPADVTGLVRQEKGRTTDVLPRLHKAGERFDLVFVDAGHDLASVVHDLSYATLMLAPGGAVLMDDFSPMDDYGIGTCVAVAQARRLYGSVEVFATDGVVFGDGASLATRGMAFLSDLRGSPHWRASRMAFWRATGWMLHRAFDPRRFPLEVTQ